MNRKERDALLDGVAEEIRRQQADPAEVTRAASRVWARVRQELASGSAEAPATGPAGTLSTCEDFRGLIPARAAGDLSPAQTLLLEDHVSGCAGCRRELRDARARAAGQAPTERAALVIPRSRLRGPAGWALAAAATIALVALGLVATTDWLPGAGGPARVQLLEGSLYRVEGATLTALAAGDAIEPGQTIRSAKGSGAVVELEDGSKLELRERSELSFTEGWRDRTVRLARGSVIVEAAPQGAGNLNVLTDDCRVAVTGTIFSVNHGTKGSRVSVIEGEVRVAHGGEEERLRPGDQVATSPRLEAVPIEAEISWSRSAERYRAVLEELAALKRELEELPGPAPRHSTRLLDLVPEGAIAYTGIPNLSVSLAEAFELTRKRIESNPVLAEWWRESTDPAAQALLAQVIEKVRLFGSLLGEEIVVTLQADERGEFAGVLVLATLEDAASFRSLLEEELSRLEAMAGEDIPLRVVTDLTGVPSPAPGAEPEEIYVVVRDDLLLTGTHPHLMAKVLAQREGLTASSFRGSDFYRRLEAAYREGAGWIFGADLERILVPALRGEKDSGETLERLGLLDLRHLIVERKEVEEGMLNRAVLDFGRERRGVAAWLGEPAPMGSLEFVSPNAHLAIAGVVRRPAAILEELLGVLESLDPAAAEGLRAFETSQGLSLLEDVARPLGGEFAFALDGPLLPPSWILAFEVYDAPRLQQTLEALVARLAPLVAAEGGPELRLTQEAVGDRVVHSLHILDPFLVVHYEFVDGYLLAAPQPGLLDRALRNRASGATLPRAPEFLKLLPRDEEVNVSALAYQNLAPALGPLAESLALGGQIPEEKREGMIARALLSELPATLACAYAEEDRIVLAGLSDAWFGTALNTMMGFGSILGGLEAHP